MPPKKAPVVVKKPVLKPVPLKNLPSITFDDFSESSDLDEKKPVLKRKAENNNNSACKAGSDSEESDESELENNKKQKEDKPLEFIEAYNDYQDIAKYFKSEDLQEAKQWLHEQFTKDKTNANVRATSYNIERHQFGKEESSAGLEMYVYNPEDFLTTCQKNSLSYVELLIHTNFIPVDKKQPLLDWLEESQLTLELQ